MSTNQLRELRNIIKERLHEDAMVNGEQLRKPTEYERGIQYGIRLTYERMLRLIEDRLPHYLAISSIVGRDNETHTSLECLNCATYVTLVTPAGVNTERYVEAVKEAHKRENPPT